jgi:hypothetical protein
MYVLYLHFNNGPFTYKAGSHDKPYINISSINSEQEAKCQYKYLMSIIWEFTLIFILVLYLLFNNGPFTYKAGSHDKPYINISSINSEQETKCQYKYLMSIIWEFTLIFILVLYLHFNNGPFTFKAGSHDKPYNKHQQWAGSKMSKYDLRHNQLKNQGHRSAMLILKSYWKLDSMNGFVCFSSFLYFHALFCLVIFLSLWVHSCLWFKVYIVISCSVWWMVSWIKLAL